MHTIGVNYNWCAGHTTLFTVYRSCFNLGVVISVSITEIVIHDMIGRECCAKVCT